MMEQLKRNLDLINANGMSSVQQLVNRCLNTFDLITMGKRTLRMPYWKELERIDPMIKSFLKAKAGDGIFMDDTGLTAFHVACVLREKSTVMYYLKRNVDVNSPVKSKSELWPGWTPLHFAACCSVQTMILLMQHGADITMKNSNGETALYLCAKRFATSDIQAILSTKKEFRDIVLSDGCTKLLDVLLAMNDYEKFHVFVVKLKDVNITIPSDSAIWPGYNLLHLSVSLNEKTKLSDESEVFKSRKNNKSIKNCTCTKDEEALYGKRIQLLMNYGCSTCTKNADGQTPIHLGFVTSSEATLKQLLVSDQDNSVDRNGISHLHLACAFGQLATVKRYINRGANVNIRTTVACSWHREQQRGRLDIRENSTPLHVAVIGRHKDVVQYLLANNADVYATDALGFTAIHLAMSLYEEDVTQLLLNAITSNLRHSASPIGLGHLHAAAWLEDSKVVERLLLDGADIEGVIGTDDQRYTLLERYCGITPLHVALEDDGDNRTFDILLKAGANIYAKNLEGETVLQVALFNESRYWSVKDLIRVLKESEERYDVESAGMTLLHVACSICDVEWAKRLLEQGADVDARVRGSYLDGATPLYLVFNGMNRDYWDYEPEYSAIYDLAELLVNSGADVTIECRGCTPLHLIYQRICLPSYSDLPDEDACELSYAVDLLLSNQTCYRFNPMDKSGFSHFHLACMRHDVEIVTKFLDHGADVNGSIHRSDDRYGGYTPLHLAIESEITAVAHLLLERGADVNAKDADGNTPLHAAFKNEFIDLPLIEAMIRLGSDVHKKNFGDQTLLHFLVHRFNATLTSDEYLNIIERMGISSCLHQRDVKGKTPLHLAMEYRNLTAMEAIFCIGVDVNSLYMEEEFHWSNIEQAIMRRKKNVTTELACHIWKIRFIGFDLTNASLEFLKLMENEFSLVTLLEQPCQDELTKAKNTEICEGITVNDFLSELGAAAAYPIMHPTQRAIVDEYFKRIVDLHREFPEFCGLLVSQYKKALVRLELMKPAMKAICSICQVKLPDLCSEAVLRYFKNSEMEIVIEVAKVLSVKKIVIQVAKEPFVEQRKRKRKKTNKKRKKYNSSFIFS